MFLENSDSHELEDEEQNMGARMAIEGVKIGSSIHACIFRYEYPIPLTSAVEDELYTRQDTEVYGARGRIDGREYLVGCSSLNNNLRYRTQLKNSNMLDKVLNNRSC